MIYGNASAMDKLELGMNKAQVLDIMGGPVATEADADKGEEKLVFKKMRHTISEWPRLFFVTIRDGKVVRWGEQVDKGSAVIQQEQTINVNTLKSN